MMPLLVISAGFGLQVGMALVVVYGPQWPGRLVLTPIVMLLTLWWLLARHPFAAGRWRRLLIALSATLPVLTLGSLGLAMLAGWLPDWDWLLTTSQFMAIAWCPLTPWLPGGTWGQISLHVVWNMVCLTATPSLLVGLTIIGARPTPAHRDQTETGQGGTGDAVDDDVLFGQQGGDENQRPPHDQGDPPPT